AASKSGKKVLLVERRSALGYELTAKSRFFLDKNGSAQFGSELQQLFAPDGEKPEVHNKKVTSQSTLEDDLVLMAGSLQKGLRRNALVNRIDGMLMTDVGGLF